LALHGVIFLCLLFFFGLNVSAQPSPETRRNLIKELEEKNRAENVKATTSEASLTPDQTGGFEDLKQEMANARLALASAKTDMTRMRAAQATINYVDPLAKVEQYDEAVSALKTSLEIGAAPGVLVQKLGEVRVAQSSRLFDAGDWAGTRFLLDDTWRTARSYKIPSIEKEFAQRLRDLMAAWAESLRRSGQTIDARAKATEALTWKIDTEEIEALLARICYQMDDYKECLDHLRLALRGSQRDSQTLLAFQDLVQKELGLERSYRRKDLKGFVVSSPGGLAIDEAGLASAFGQARENAEKMLGLKSPLPLRVELFQQNSYQSFFLSPNWNKALSLHGKLRIQMDSVQGKATNLQVVAKYAYGLWVVDVLTEGAAPAWFQEGVAHQLAFPDGPPNGGINEINDRLSKKTLLPFKDLTLSFLAIPDLLDAAVVMAQSQSGIQVILKKKGLEAIPQLVEAYASGLDPDTALRQAAGFGYDAFQDIWVKEANKGFRTNPKPDLPALRALGIISPMGSYWEK
jgi:tetratricopeptide (TPR) repeat protein